MGFDANTEANKSWLKKAIDKQPVTFMQIIVTILIALLTAVGGWAIGRYITPVEHQREIPVQQTVTNE